MKKGIKFLFITSLGLFLSACNFNADIWDTLNRSIDTKPAEIGDISYSINAIDGQYIRIEFTEPMNPVTISTATITVAADGVSVDGSWAYDDVTMVATFIPTFLFQRGYEHVVAISTMVQTAAMSYLSDSYDFVFMTPPATAVLTSGVNPVYEANNVPPDSAIRIPFSQNIDATSINTASMTVIADGVDVNGTWAYNPSTRTAVFTLDSGVNYPRSATVNVNVTDAVLDAYGYPFDAGFSSRFYVLAGAYVVNFLPGNGMVDVIPGSPIQVYFDQTMDPLSLTSSNMPVTANGIPVSGYWSYSDTMRMAEFIPDTGYDFPRDANVDVFVSFGVLDWYGTPVGYEEGFSFHTLLPTFVVTPTAPFNGETDVALNSTISIVFSQPVLASSINTSTMPVTANSMPVSGTWTYYPASREAVFTLSPGTHYPKGTVVYVDVSAAIEDIYGDNLISSHSFNFTTLNYAVMVLGSTPNNGTTGVLPDSTITLDFSTAMDPATIDTSTITVVDGVGSPIGGSWTYLDATLQAVFTTTPGTYLPRDTDVTVSTTAYIEDYYGNPLDSPFSITFHTLQLPVVALPTYPDNGASGVALNYPITIRFSLPMDGDSISDASIFVTHGGTPVSGSWSYSEGTQEAVFTPGGYYPRGADIQVAVTGPVEDIYGGPIGSPYVFNFAVDNTAVTVMTTTPLAGAAGLDEEIPISVNFSEAMNQTSGWRLEVVDMSAGGTVVHTFNNSTPGISWSGDSMNLVIGSVHHSFGEPGSVRQYQVRLYDFTAAADGYGLNGGSGSYSYDYSVRTSWEDIPGIPEDGKVYAAPKRPVTLIQDGTNLHLAYVTDGNQIFVYTYNVSGNAWVRNNTTGFPADATSSVDLVISGGYLHIAYIEYIDGIPSGVVRRMNGIDNWEYLSFTPSLQGNYTLINRISKGPISDIRIADNNGFLYAAFNQTETVTPGWDNGEAAGVYLLERAWDGTNWTWAYAGQPGNITSDPDVNTISVLGYSNLVYVGYSYRGFYSFKTYNRIVWSTKKTKTHVGVNITNSTMSIVAGYPLMAAHIDAGYFVFNYYNTDPGVDDWADYTADGGKDLFTTDMQRSALFVDEAVTGMPYFVYKAPSSGDQKLHIKYAENPDPLNGVYPTAWATPAGWDIISTGYGDAPALVILDKVIYVAYFENTTGYLKLRRHY